MKLGSYITYTYVHTSVQSTEECISLWRLCHNIRGEELRPNSPFAPLLGPRTPKVSSGLMTWQQLYPCPCYYIRGRFHGVLVWGAEDEGKVKWVWERLSIDKVYCSIRDIPLMEWRVKASRCRSSALKWDQNPSLGLSRNWKNYKDNNGADRKMYWNIVLVHKFMSSSLVKF
jgi:hypothetical protein